MFNFAVQNEWLIKNPFALSNGVISMSAEVERDNVLSFDEEARLLAACVEKRASQADSHLRFGYGDAAPGTLQNEMA